MLKSLIIIMAVTSLKHHEANNINNANARTSLGIGHSTANLILAQNKHHRSDISEGERTSKYKIVEINPDWAFKSPYKIMSPSHNFNDIGVKWELIENNIPWVDGNELKNNKLDLIKKDIERRVNLGNGIRDAAISMDAENQSDKQIKESF